MSVWFISLNVLYMMKIGNIDCELICSFRTLKIGNLDGLCVYLLIVSSCSYSYNKKQMFSLLSSILKV